MAVTRSLFLSVEVKNTLSVRVSVTAMVGVIRQFSACAETPMHSNEKPSKDAEAWQQRPELRS
ncbi:MULTISPECIES: hypothetical protein [Candidatus Accumulibacter]|uniref:hypothetical protein n=1 Tax=Candidatus Accumulibacter TaxID=327159 RepID=UPI00207BA107|nr:MULTISPECIES: hypothetical protein [Candidatus Accumulibacter]HRF11511.1 hypothetical protein [Candidatus Accumulibacter phosphatis]